MSIRIDREKCVGCGKCAEVCPGTLIDFQDKKAVMKYPRDCWGCISCVKECHVEAIEFYLGADIGGNGSIMSVNADGNVLHWKIRNNNQTTITIDVDRRNANKY